MGGGQPPPEPRADNGTASSLTDLLDIRWDNKEMVWDDSNPHPQLDVPPDVFFIREAHDNLLTINPDSDVTRGLQELGVIFPGRIQRDRKSDGLSAGQARGWSATTRLNCRASMSVIVSVTS